MEQVLLAAGKGLRLNNNKTNKCFTKIANKSLLDYNLELGLDLGVSKMIIIVGYNAKYIIDYLGYDYFTIPIKYVYQKPQLGIAHAIKVAINDISDSFFMCLSDELLINPRIKEMQCYFESLACDCICGMVHDTNINIQKSYTMKFDHNNKIEELIEKPTSAFNNYKGTGYCMMSKKMLSSLEYLEPNGIRDEYEMGDWIQLAISFGANCYGFEIADADFNINTLTDLEIASDALGGQ